MAVVEQEIEDCASGRRCDWSDGRHPDHDVLGAAGVKIIRDRDTRAISLSGTTLCTLGVLLWLVYGLAIVDGPLIGSSIITFAMTATILVLKIRHG